MNLINTLGVVRTAKFWKELIIMTIAMMVASSAVYYFMVPADLVLGSISGLSIVLCGVLEMFGIQFKVSLMIVIVNAFLLILAWLLIGKEFGAKTVYTAMILGPCMDLWELVLPYQKLIPAGQTSIMGDLWFDLLCFVLIVSISQAILFRINASTGGLDILAKIVNKYFHFDIGRSITVAGVCICLTSFAINPFNLVVVGLVGTWINGIAVDYFMAMLNRRKRVCIISPEYQRINEYLGKSLHKSSTLYPVVGGYSGEERIEIQTLITQTEFAALLEYIKTNRIRAFVTAGNVSEAWYFE